LEKTNKTFRERKKQRGKEVGSKRRRRQEKEITLIRCLSIYDGEKKRESNPVPRNDGRRYPDFKTKKAGENQIVWGEKQKKTDFWHRHINTTNGPAKKKIF